LEGHYAEILSLARFAAEPSNHHRRLLLLRSRREWPGGYSAAEQRDEFAPSHGPPLPWQLAQQLLRNAYNVVFTVM
jgi:hypothetical protein